MLAWLWTGTFCSDEVGNVAERLRAVQKKDDAMRWSVGIVLVRLDVGRLAILWTMKIGVGSMVDLRNRGPRCFGSLLPWTVGDGLAFELLHLGSLLVAVPLCPGFCRRMLGRRR